MSRLARWTFKLAFSAAALVGTPARAAYHWAPVNTCWGDFDVGGGEFCGLRTTACATAGISETDRVHCGVNFSEGSPVLPTFGGIGHSVPPAAKAIALDETGFVYLVGVDNRIYRQPSEFGETWGQFASPGLTCISKLSVALNSTGTSPRILALGCDSAKTLRRYASPGGWTTIATNVIDISTLTFGTTRYLSYLSGDGTRPILRSAATGSGTFTTFVTNTNIVDAWVYNGRNVSRTLHTFIIGDKYGHLDGYSTCTGGSTSGVGRRWFHDFALGNSPPDPVCQFFLQPPPYAFNFPALTKITGTGGPWNDVMWVLTNQARVYALVN